MRVLELFKQIASIPHCSGDTAALRDFIVEFARNCGFKSLVDNAGNILCYRSKRRICLQAHYDMVCVGQAPKIELIEEDGWLRAKNSSLGADNGIGVAMMLALMREGKEAEYLFTNDEEIGLIGAINLGLELEAKQMINLDSEEFGAIYVGCAGGADVEAACVAAFEKRDGFFYEVRAKNFPGGHSGVDIDKNIPSAIKEFAHFVGEAEIGALKAGERRNSIPATLTAKVATRMPLESNEFFDVEAARPFEVAKAPIVPMLLAYAHGVRGWHKEFDIPYKSANLAIVELDAQRLAIQTSLRANSDEALERLVDEERAFFELLGFDVSVSGEYPAWEPKVTPLAQTLQRAYEPYGGASLKAIHAGLECAVFAKKYPDMQIASIGPTIEYPHSLRERVRIADIEPIYSILKGLL
ncbi:MAG: aminoacyl-histidine dipeptidase [Epsilonproteobacteria bacterium]|nr:aminoacyl-histidine dipeptidase [Campylobacterota bacterium]NPA64324.1 aminoacyl-histidine dipeptidase [Campylobacterota bacterium]